MEEMEDIFQSELGLCLSKTREKSALERIIAGKPYFFARDKKITTSYAIEKEKFFWCSNLGKVPQCPYWSMAWWWFRVCRQYHWHSTVPWVVLEINCIMLESVLRFKPTKKHPNVINLSFQNVNLWKSMWRYLNNCLAILHVTCLDMPLDALLLLCQMFWQNSPSKVGERNRKRVPNGKGKHGARWKGGASTNETKWSPQWIMHQEKRKRSALSDKISRLQQARNAAFISFSTIVKRPSSSCAP